MKMTMTIEIPVEVSRETLGLWVSGMLNVPNIESNWAGFSEDQERELALLDEMDNDVEVTWAGNGAPADSDAHSAACVAVVDMMDAEKRLRREISLMLLARFGINHQADKVVEELAECMAAFVQFRNGRKSWTDLAKEVADVLTVVEHISHIVANKAPTVLAEKFQAVVRVSENRNWDDLSHLASDYEDVEP